MDEHGARRLRRFAEEAGRGLRGLDASVWRNRIEGRRRELEAAFDWLLDHGRASDALAMACTLAEFLRITGRVATGRRWLDRALAAAPSNDRLRAAGLYEHGMLAFWQGADEDACSLHGRSLQLARRLGDPTAVALALCGLARVALREDLDWARTLCEEALQAVEATDDRIGRANALHVLGVAAQMQGNLEQARDLMTRRIEAARQRGDYLAVSSECTNLSMIERQGNAWPPDEVPTSNTAGRPSPPRWIGNGSSKPGPQAATCHRRTRCGTPSPRTWHRPSWPCPSLSRQVGGCQDPKAP